MADEEEKQPTLRDVMDVILKNNQDNNIRHDRAERHILALWKVVTGKDPNGGPPNAEGLPQLGDPSMPPPDTTPIIQHVSGHDLELAALRSDVAQVQNIVARTDRETSKQSNFLGIGLRGIQYLTSPAGRKSVTTYMAAIGALIAAAAGAYNTFHQPAPAPPTHAPVHQEASK